jgi:uncharacterized protein
MATQNANSPELNSGDLQQVSRRNLLKGMAALALAPRKLDALASTSHLPAARPGPAERHFTSPAVETEIVEIRRQISDRDLATLFENCFPNTLDTTVFPGTFEGHPDTFVVTGDIEAMWLRDSSAQVWPYLPLCKRDPKLRELIEGVIRRQARMIATDPYANAFTRNPGDPPLSWAVQDKTTKIPGVAERKWEIDSLCYSVRLAHGYWQATGDTSPFDQQWKEAARAVLRTFREQQRKSSPGPYSFQREALNPTDTVPLGGFGNPARSLGLIFSMFRPSDDACIFPLFIPANHFAVLTLRRLAELAANVLHEASLAQSCHELATEVEQALRQHGIVQQANHGPIWAYEVDGYGGVNRMDDANAPGLVSLAYLGCCRIDDPLYQRSRSFALSTDNPYFFRGKVAEGVGSPHTGLNYIWPISILMRGLTSTNETEMRRCLRTLRDTTARKGFMHESFHCDNDSDFTRPWFAWANTLFGEWIVKLAQEHPALLTSPLG